MSGARRGGRAARGAELRARVREAAAAPPARAPSGRGNGLAYELGGTPAPPADTGIRVSMPSDPTERDADAIAARALSGAAPQGWGLGEAGKAVVRRACETCKKEDDDKDKKEGATKATVHRDGEGDAVVTPAVARALHGMAGAGAPLPESERRFFEGRFGYELGHVRIHDDARAGETARGLGARAFTFGNDVAVAPGRFQPDTPGGRQLLAHELAHVVQQGSAAPLRGAGAPAVGRSGGAAQVARAADPAAESPAESEAPAAAEPGAAAATEEAAPAGGGLVVEDEALTLLSGQARKSAFLADLRQAACAAADQVLARSGRNTAGCPYVEKALAFYAGRPAAHVERAARKMVGGAPGVRSAAELVPLFADRVSEGVEAWLATGALPSNLPDELQGVMPGSGAALSAASAASSAVSGLLFKDAPGGANRGADRTALSARLGPGRPLDSSTRTRMESAFGQSLGGVRIHDDAAASSMSRDLNAHAFSLGSHVAFSQGTYSPGTLAGDALLAHELAHVVQQGGAAAQASGGRSGANVSAELQPALEQDADAAAAGVVAALWGGGKKRLAKPRGRSGLALQRCTKEAPPAFGSVDTIVNNVKGCDGGTGLWAAATLGNGKKEPAVKSGRPSSGFPGETDAASGVITIASNVDACTATQILVHELSNVSRAPDLNQIAADAKNGNVSRDDYIRGNERIEYETGVLNMFKAFDACSQKWGCAAGTPDIFKTYRAAKNFDDYFNNFLIQSHKDFYAKWWDDNYKSTWKTKHP